MISPLFVHHLHGLAVCKLQDVDAAHHRVHALSAESIYGSHLGILVNDAGRDAVGTEVVVAELQLFGDDHAVGNHRCLRVVILAQSQDAAQVVGAGHLLDFSAICDGSCLCGGIVG